jgi:hypothetical protein
MVVLEASSSGPRYFSRNLSPGPELVGGRFSSPYPLSLGSETSVCARMTSSIRSEAGGRSWSPPAQVVRSLFREDGSVLGA